MELLAATSLFLGLTNCLPLLMLDGGQILFLLLEGWFPSMRSNEQTLFLISYCILALLIAGPMLFVLIQEIRTTYPILLMGVFVLYRVIRLTPGFSLRMKK
ncbi:site-2 protease family protein [Exiguobacterium acetylicum]|uniref:site-2 protease family protein n=1 Tax=Exiguobacterium acetylicum TaxID=41170 RepID=UPI0035A8BD98